MVSFINSLLFYSQIFLVKESFYQFLSKASINTAVSVIFFGFKIVDQLFRVDFPQV